MTHLHPTIHINATPEKIWKILWDDATYRIWCAPFCEGTYYQADRLEEGGKIHFLTPDGDGMHSVIYKLIPNRLMTFKHLGSIINFKEVAFKPGTEAWSDFLETYELTPENNGTTLKITFSTTDEYKEFMINAFAKALQEVKRMAEG